MEWRLASGQMVHFPFFGALTMPLIGFGLMFTVSGCGPNHRIYSKGNVTLHAEFKNGEPVYHTVEIGTPTDPVDLNMPLELRMPDGKILELSSLRANRIRELSHSETDYDEFESDWPRGTKRFFVGGNSFVVSNEKILQAEASTVALESAIRIKKLPGGWEANVPVFRRPGFDKEYKMPLTQAEVEELFGKPDSLKDSTHK